MTSKGKLERNSLCGSGEAFQLLAQVSKAEAGMVLAVCSVVLGLEGIQHLLHAVHRCPQLCCLCLDCLCQDLQASTLTPELAAASDQLALGCCSSTEH